MIIELVISAGFFTAAWAATYQFDEPRPPAEAAWERPRVYRFVLDSHPANHPIEPNSPPLHSLPPLQMELADPDSGSIIAIDVESVENIDSPAVGPIEPSSGLAKVEGETLGKFANGTRVSTNATETPPTSSSTTNGKGKKNKKKSKTIPKPTTIPKPVRITDDWTEGYAELPGEKDRTPVIKVTYDMFCQAAQSYSVTRWGGGIKGECPPAAIYERYCQIIGDGMGRREAAMFLANVVWETAGFRHVNELACSDGRCQYGRYFGRGYLQLTWDYNYREASLAIYGDDRLLRHPEMVATISGGWRTAAHYWKTHVRPALMAHDALPKNALGYSIMAINGAIECTQRGQNAYERLKIFNDILVKWKLTELKGMGTLEGCRPGSLSEIYGRWIEDILPVTITEKEVVKEYITLTETVTEMETTTETYTVTESIAKRIKVKDENVPTAPTSGLMITLSAPQAETILPPAKEGLLNDFVE